MRRPITLGATALALLAAAPAAQAADPPVAATANGNMLTGGLSFMPARLTVPVGTVIAWRNTDPLAPHTVTELHGLWDLAGGYFPTPITPAGFGPGMVAQRAFEAGTHQFLCRVHPKDMRGTVAVPVTVSAARSKVRAKRRRGHKRPRARTIATVSLRWAAAGPAPGESFDVQRRLPGGAWTELATATATTASSFRTKPGTTWEIRARLRGADATRVATDWSPTAAISG